MQTQSNNPPVQWLEAEYLRRREGNSRYSLRSYAKSLGMPAGRLSEILSGKRKLTKALGAKVAERLGLPPSQRNVFVQGYALGENLSPDKDYALIEEDTFAVMADWYHTAFLALMDSSNFRSDSSWISKRLGISPLETRAMIHRLERLGLILRNTNGLKKTNKDLRTPDGVPSAALKKSHRDSLLQAIESLEQTPIADRDITSMTMAIDPVKLPLAKNLIREFRYKLAELLEAGKTSEVYNLNIQLVPVTKKEKKS